MKRTAWFVLVVLVVSGCGRSANQPSTASTAATADQSATANSDAAAAGVNKMLADYTTAWLASDAARIGELYSEDTMLLPVNQPIITGRAGVVKDSQDFFNDFTPVAFEAPALEMKFANDWGYARGIYKDTYKSKADGKSISDQGKYVIIVQRQPDGSWVMTRDIHDSDGPQAVVAK